MVGGIARVSGGGYNHAMKTRTKGMRLLLRGVQIIIVFVILTLLLAAGFAWHQFRDRTPGYVLNLSLPSSPNAIPEGGLRVGFARDTINPDLSDPSKPVWLAGFDQHRAATKIHDDLEAVACVIDDGRTRLGIVVLDAIGFFHDDVIRVRRLLKGDSKIDYAIICSTHNHSTPDLMGLWGPDYLHTGVNPAYREQVIQTAARALDRAAQALQPALMASHEIPVPTEGIVADTRKPIVFDPDVRILHFVNPTNRSTIGSIVGWADHPETPWGHNTEITSDFCGVLRRTLENGVEQDGRKFAEGVGGIHLFVNGAVGGLISTTPSVNVRDPYLAQDFKEPSHEKSRALGRQLASRILPVLKSSDSQFTNTAPLSIWARTLDLPLENSGFLVATLLGLIDRGHVRWKTLRTEVAMVRIGEVSVACIPGEVYPEIVNGGIEHPPGADFDAPAVEQAPVRSLMPGRVKFIFGLANDEIGYIIPKSEWDTQPPYLYDSAKPLYGEVNSVGPNTAPLIHAALWDLGRE